MHTRPAPGSAILATLMIASTVATTAALAVVPEPAAEALAVRLPDAQYLFLRQPDAIAANPAARSFSQRLHDDLGPGWALTAWDQYAQSPRGVEGQGVVLAPGGLAAATEPELEALARGFIAGHAALFGTDGRNLEVAKIVHGASRWGVTFQQVEDGIPVMNSSVILAVHDNGRLFAFSSEVYQHIDVPLRPTIELPVARALARSAVPFDPALDLGAAPDALVIVPLHRGPGEVEFHLTHRTDVPTRQPDGLWRTYVDAHSGEIVYRTNAIEHAYQGTSKGDVEVIAYCDGDSPDWPTAQMYVTIVGVGTAVTDYDGNFSIAGSSGSHSYTAQFYGPDFNVNCISCGGDALITGTIQPDTPEHIYWDAGTYRPDERDAFYYTNATRGYIEFIDPAFFLPRYTVEVNYPDNCNANHNWGLRRLRFFSEGGGCANTAQIGDVVAHEYGHGIQGELLGGGSQGPQGLGEGNSDITGTFMVDIPTIGRGFYNCNGGIRNCDNSMQYPGDLNGQIHHDGQIICGFNWDLRLLLEAKLGQTDGKNYTASLWHFARKLYANGATNQQQQTEFYRWADDDNGNLNDGTPNWDEICEAATNHGYTCPPNPTRVTITHTPLVDRVDPAGPYAVSADVDMIVASVPTAPDAVELHYSINGGAFSMVSMSNVGGITYEGAIPTQAAGTAIAYYIRAVHNASGLEGFHPEGAPAVHHLFGVGTFDVIANNEMEADDGYTVGAPGDNATDGFWEREDPNGIIVGIVFQPEDDHTPAPGTDCWITGNPPPGSSPFVEELDGRTSLNTPIIDMTGAHMLKASFWAFTYFSVPGGTDYLDLNMSTDGGSTWTNLKHITSSSSPDWVEYSFRLSPLDYTFTNQMQFRFVADDVDSNALVEALVDDFLVEGLFGGTSGAGQAAAASPLRLRLGNATPNPFNPSTEIPYSLARESQVRLAVYDVQGRLVRNLVQAVQRAGVYAARWDGTDAGGAPASSGVYYYKLVVGDWSNTRAMVLLK